MTSSAFHTGTDVAIGLFGLYALTKFLFFFVLSYPTRRKALDKAYDGRCYATGGSDPVLLLIALVISVALLARGGEPITFLGGLLAGGTLIQLFFHAFHAPVPDDRAAPGPRSPLKIMSYAIQAEPWRPWKELLAYGALVIACGALYWFG
jgi:hypothetical protein